MRIGNLSSPLERPGRWTKGSRGPSYRHMPYPRRVFLSDQHFWIFTRSTVNYEVSLCFPLLGRIVEETRYLGPLHGPRFCSPTSFIPQNTNKTPKKIIKSEQTKVRSRSRPQSSIGTVSGSFSLSVATLFTSCVLLCFG